MRHKVTDLCLLSSSTGEDLRLYIQENIKYKRKFDASFKTVRFGSLKCHKNLGNMDLAYYVFRCFFLADIEYGQWEEDKNEGERVRKLSYRIQLNNPLGPKTGLCTQDQVIFFPHTFFLAMKKDDERHIFVGILYFSLL